MFSLYSAIFCCSDDPNSSIPASWQLIGVPQVDDLATALIRVMQAGARFSPVDDVQADALTFVTHVDSPAVDLEFHVQQQIDIICSLRDVIYGRWLPEVIRNEVWEKDQSQPLLETTCPICLTDFMPSDDNALTLYCGHRFCLECINAYAKEPLSEHQLMNRTDKRCPTCRRLICGDLLSEEYNERYRSKRIRFGVDRHEATEQLLPRTYRGPHLLSDEQLRFECKAILGKTEGPKEELLAELIREMDKYTFREYGNVIFENKSISVNEENSRVELTLSTTLITGGDDPVIYMGPTMGPVVIPIEMKGVPILASLSPNSFVTVVTPRIVHMFNLKTKPIHSTFITANGDPITVSAVIDELKFFLGRVEICLNNAVVLPTENNCIRSVQLGMDFFDSAVWIRCSTRLGEGDTFVVTDGGGTKDLLMPNQPDELRYYSRDGKICQLPFIHVKDLGDCNLPIVSLPGDMSTQFSECQWCCRYFPCEGMVKCIKEDSADSINTQYRYYCDEECMARGKVVRAGLGNQE